MKTDIFKDLVPLLEMDSKRIDGLANEIVEENTKELDKLKLSKLLVSIQTLSYLIISKI